MLATLVNTVVRTSSRPVCNLCSSCMRRDPENRRAHSNDIAASQSYSCAVGDAGHGIVFRLTRRLSLAPSPMYPHSPFTFNRNGPLLLHLWPSSWAGGSTPFGCQGKTSLRFTDAGMRPALQGWARRWVFCVSSGILPERCVAAA